MSLEKQIEELNKSIGDLIGAVDANTKVVLTLLEASSPDGRVNEKIVGTAKSHASTVPVEETTEEVTEEEPAAGEPVAEEVSEKSLKAAFKELVKVHGRPAMEDILADFEARKFSELDAPQYDAVMAAITEQMEA